MKHITAFLAAFLLLAGCHGDNQVRDVGSQDLNDYLRQITGSDFTAKDFRTWAGTVLAAQALQEIGAFTTQKQGKKNIVQAAKSVAKQLGNTKALCRKCYIHPAIFDSYLDGTLANQLSHNASAIARSSRQFNSNERFVLSLLQRRLTRASKAA